MDDLGNHIDISVNVEDNYLDINVQGHIQQPITFILRNSADIEGITLDDKVIEGAEGLHDLDVNHYAMKDSTLMIKISHQKKHVVELLSVMYKCEHRYSVYHVPVYFG